MQHLAVFGLIVPIWHACTGHRLLARLAGIVQPGTGVSLTEHERRHAARSAPVRLAANLAWLVYMAACILLALQG